MQQVKLGLNYLDIKDFLGMLIKANNIELHFLGKAVVAEIKKREMRDCYEQILF